MKWCVTRNTSLFICVVDDALVFSRHHIASGCSFWCNNAQINNVYKQYLQYVVYDCSSSTQYGILCSTIYPNATILRSSNNTLRIQLLPTLPNIVEYDHWSGMWPRIHLLIICEVVRDKEYIFHSFASLAMHYAGHFIGMPVCLDVESRQVFILVQQRADTTWCNNVYKEYVQYVVYDCRSSTQSAILCSTIYPNAAILQSSNNTLRIQLLATLPNIVECDHWSGMWQIGRALSRDRVARAV